MVEWSDKYLVGIPRIDWEHKIFLDLINDLETTIRQTTRMSDLKPILEEIILYARFHFRSEENIMAKIGYPDLEAHRKMHYALIEALNNRETEIAIGIAKPDEILSFLIDWFANHTATEDLKIRAYMETSKL